MFTMDIREFETWVRRLRPSLQAVARRMLAIKVTGSGEITYSGNPSVINSNNVKKSNRKQVDTEEVMEGL